MAEAIGLDHIFVGRPGRDEVSTRRGAGDPRIRPVEDRAAHGSKLRQEIETSARQFEQVRDAAQLEELKSLGVVVTVRAASAEYPLKLESFDAWTRGRARLPRWQLLAVTSDHEGREVAVVWIADSHLGGFFKLFDDYLNRMRPPSQRHPNGHPVNDSLIANMSEIRRAVAKDLWTSPGDPPDGATWWELVVRRTDDDADLLVRIGEALSMEVAPQVLIFDDRVIAWVRCRWSQLETLVLSALPLHEIRKPSQVGSVLDLSLGEQDDYVDDLLGRIDTGGRSGESVVCLLDTGVLGQHVLLTPHLDSSSLHSAIGSEGPDDWHGHGTLMSGLAIYGDLQEHFESSEPIEITHRLESVKILSSGGPTPRDKYALVTAQAVALPELSRQSRQRVFALAVTAQNEPARGEPTSWSAAVDALAAGADVDQLPDGSIRLLTAPDGDLSRLFVVSAGNVRERPDSAYLDRADLTGIETPAQAWNALTVGAFTRRSVLPIDPSFAGWTLLADEGELSPHSRTSVTWDRQWAIKPDVVCEGGNALVQNNLFDTEHPSVALTSTSRGGLTSIATANATSAATALAANLSARIYARYPQAWPETVRALVVDSARWTDAMTSRFEPVSKRARLALLRRYGWGVPNEARALASGTNTATLIIQDEFRPFDGPDFRIARFRLHDLPWPAEALRSLDAADVRLRVTLSYFIEPTVSHRGWRARYSYASHGLRFELKRPAETDAAFIRRINNSVELDADGERVPSAADDAKWYIGPQQRDRGSLIADIWTGTAVALADCDRIAVRATGGWWKYGKRADRVDAPVRYALVMSLETDEQEVDLRTAIANKLQVPIPIEIAT